jgi:ferrochelatase
MTHVLTPSTRRRAVVLVNLGTPEAPTTSAVRRYYREFLSDSRVVDLNPVARAALVNLIIVPFRAPKVAPLYESIWMPGGSPLLVHTQALGSQVQALMPDTEVKVAMRYGEPSLKDALAAIDGLRIRDVTIIPLFPHEASATTGSVKEAVYGYYRGHPRIPALRVVAPFFSDEGFLSAMDEHLRQTLPPDVQHVMFSYHGLPERQVRREDGVGGCLADGCCASLNQRSAHCYRAQCFATTRLLAQRLGLSGVSTVFQSRLGRDPWIRPFAEPAIDELAQQGIRRVAVVTPGFVTDCLETLEELGVRMKERFRARGGILTVVPCLNGSQALATALAGLARGPFARAPDSALPEQRLQNHHRDDHDHQDGGQLVHDSKERVSPVLRSVNELPSRDDGEAVGGDEAHHHDELHPQPPCLEPGRGEGEHADTGEN